MAKLYFIKTEIIYDSIQPITDFVILPVFLLVIGVQGNNRLYERRTRDKSKIQEESCS